MSNASAEVQAVCTFCWKRPAIGHLNVCHLCEEEVDAAKHVTTRPANAKQADGERVLEEVDHKWLKDAERMPKGVSLPHQMSTDSGVSTCSSADDSERITELLEELEYGSTHAKLIALKHLSESVGFCAMDLLQAGALTSILPIALENSLSEAHSAYGWKILTTMGTEEPDTLYVYGGLYQDGLIPSLLRIMTSKEASLSHRRNSADLFNRLLICSTRALKDLKADGFRDQLCSIIDTETDDTLVFACRKAILFIESRDG